MKAHPAPPRFETLEARILYSADAALLLGAHGLAEPAQVRVLEAAPAVADARESAHQAAHEIVFIDSRVPDAMRLADELARTRSNGSLFDIVVIGAEEDGVQQIGDVLAHEHGLTAIHIISHGSDGALQLGSSALDAQRLAADGAALARWGDALAPGGDLLLYGCDVAQGAAGQLFVRELAGLTGASVAASTGLTGSAALGGDWTLEYATGAVHTQLTAQRFDRLDWAGVLATYTVTNTNNAGSGSLRQAITNANANSGTDSIVFAIGAAPVGGVYTIAPTSALPQITDRVSIDGTTQAGFAGAPLIVLDGAGAGSTDGLTLAVGSGGSTIRGLVIGGFNGGVNNEAIRVTSDNNLIAGNWIGLDGSGAAANANYAGISIDGSGNTLGGSSAADRNVISGSATYGVNIDGASANTNLVIGNYIGTDASGSAALGNTLMGVRINQGVNGNRIGGTAAGEGNVIANTRSGPGIGFSAGSGTASFLGNSIFGNAGIGIDLLVDGVTANDVGDADSGPNFLQNTPVLRGAGSTGGKTVVIGSLNSNPWLTYRVEFFESAIGDASGYGEGQRYIGFTTVTTDAAGNASFSKTLSGVTVTAGHAVSATATVDLGSGSYGSSSEFSANVQARSQMQLAPTQDTYINSGSTANNYGNSGSLIVDRSGSGLGNVRSLLQFDLSSLPAGAVITGAELLLNASANAQPFSVGVYELTSAWAEGSGVFFTGASWTDRTVFTNWGTAGGDVNPTAVASLTSSALGEHAWDITALAQAWQTGAKANNGILLGSPDNAGSSTITYDSREGATPPRLALTYYVPNAAPVLDASKSPVLGAVSEDAGAPSGAVGTLVSSLVDFAVPAGQVDNVTDADAGAQLGIAVTAADTSHGSWWTSLDNGANWQALGAVSDATARLLNADGATRLYFRPDADWNGALAQAITFRAWDRTSGANGEFADTTSSGGSTAFSAATDGAALPVNPVNDAPADLYALPGLTAAGLTGVYGFDAPNNLGRDDSGHGATMTLYGNPAQTAGPAGSLALDLAGGASGQYGEIAGIGSGGAMSFAASVRFDSTASWQRVFDFGTTDSGGIGSVFLSRLSNSNDLSFSVEKNGSYTYRATAPGAITNGTWLHVAATVDATGAMKLYVNGVLAATQAGVAPEVGVRAHNYVGKSNWAIDGAFDGAIENFVVASGAMSAAQVAALYQQSTGFAVAENAANGSALGSVVAFGPDANDTYSYALTNDAGGRFAVNASDGTLTVANGALLDYESASTHTVTVRVTDQGGLSYSESFTVTLSDVNDAPAITSGATTSLGSAYSEDAATPAFAVSGIVSAVGWSDADSGAVRGMLVTAASGNGRWQYSTDLSSWQDLGSVTASNGLLLDHNSSLRYVGDARNGETPTLQFRAWDESSGSASTNGAASYADPGAGGGSSAFSAQTAHATTSIFSVNDAPVLDASGTMVFTAINEDQAGNAGQTVASVIASAGGDRITDVDNGALEGIAVNASSNGNGAWEYSLDGGGSWLALGTVADNSALLLRDSDLLRFAPNGQNGTTASLGFRAWDRSSGSAGSRVDASSNGGSSAFSTASTTAAISVSAVNDAPVLGNAGPIGLGPTDEDTPSAATLVSDLLISAGQSDVDNGASSGLAVTATSGRGSFQYSTDGVGWVNFGSVSAGNALLLDSASRVRYLPDGIDGETASFVFQAWDQSSGSASTNATAQHANAGSGGGSSAFSTLAATVQIAVAAVNDAPLITSVTGTLNYVENSGPVVIGGTATVSDVDSPDFDGGQLTVQLSVNGQPEDRLSLQHQGNGAGQVGIAGSVIRYGGVVIGSFNGPVTGSTPLVATFNANSTAAIVQAVARRISYEDTSDNPSTLTRSVQTTLTDGDGGSSNTLLGNITTSRVNDAPTIAVVAPRTTDEDVHKTFSVFIGNAITVGDVDAGNGLLRLTVTAQHGTVTLGHLSGLAFSVGDGTNDVTMTFTGTLANLNNALDGITYDPDADYNGPASLDFVLNDLGNSGSGGALSASATQGITVLAVNDAPVIADGTPLALISIDEDTPSAPLSVAGILGNAALGYADADAPALRGLAVTAALGRGRWQYSDDGANWADVGTVSAGNALLLDAGMLLRYVPDGRNGEAASLGFRAWDQSSGTASTNAAPAFANPGAGGGSSAFSSGTASLLASASSVNDAPSDLQLAPQPATVAENSANGTLVATAVVTDVDTGDSATFSLTDSAAGRFVIDAATGVIRVADATRLDFEAARSHSITVRVTDGGGLTLDRVFTIGVGDVNEAPSATADAASAAEAGGTANGTPGIDPSGNVFANDSDPDAGDGLTLVGVAAGPAASASGPVGSAVAGNFGTITINADGSYRYTVDNANATVQALRDAAATLEDSFTYTLRDHAGLLSSALITVTIHGADDAPVLTSAAAVTVAENSRAVLTVTASDLDAPAQALGFSISGGADAARFTIDAATGALAFVTAPDFERPADADGDGVYDVIVSASDGVLSSAQAIAVTVANVNEAPQLAANAGLTVDENSSGNTIGPALLRSSDVDSGSTQLVYSLNAATSHGSLRLNGVVLAANGSFTQADIDAGRLSYSHDGSETTADGFDFSVDDGQGLGFSDRFEITVTPVNRHAPVITSAAAVSVLENGTAVLQVMASDADLPAAALRFAIVGGADAARFTIDAATGVLAFVAAPDFEAPADADANGVYELVVAASDGSLTGTQALAVTVGNVNEAPTLGLPGAQTVAEDGTLRFGPAWSNALTLADPDGGGVGISPAMRLVVSVTHGGLSTAGQAGAPTLTLDGDLAGLNAALAGLRFDPDANFNGSAVLSLAFDDGAGLAAQGSVAITVTAVDDAPQLLANAGLTLAENSVGTPIGPGALFASDVDSPPADIVYTLVDAPAHGSLRLGGALLAANDSFTQADIDAGRLRYDHDGSETTADGFGFSLDGGRTSSRFAMVITPVDDQAPEFTSAAAVAVAENGLAVLTAAVSDADGPGPVVYAISGGADAARFRIDAASGALTFINAPDFERPEDAAGANRYVVTVSASSGAFSSMQTITVDVLDRNEAPGAADRSVALDEDSVYRFSAADFGFRDADAGDALGAVRIDSLPAGGTLSLGGSALRVGQVIAAADLAQLGYAPAADENGDANAFSFSVSDRAGLWSAAPATLRFAITAVEDAPVLLRATGITVAENAVGSVITNAMLALGDVDSAPAQRVYTVGAAPLHGSLRLNGAALAAGDGFTQADIDAGRLSYDHDGSETTADGFAFSIDGGQASARFAISVTPVDDNPPRIVSDGGGAVAQIAVDENSRAVTTVVATDADLPSATLSYRIAGGADAARFAIDAVSGALSFIVAPDFEAPGDADADNVYELVVEASDGSLATQQALRVAVRNVDEAPASADVLLSTPEDTPHRFSAAEFGFSDPDAGDTLGSLRVEAIGGQGSFRLADATPLRVGQTLSAAEIAGLVFTPATDGNGPAYATLRLRVVDAAGLVAAAASTLTIDVGAVDDAPLLGAVQLQVRAGEAVTLGGLQFEASDVDSAALRFVVSEVREGRFEALANPGVAIDSFSQADLLAGRVRFVALSLTTAPSFRVAVSDGTLSSAAVAASVGFTPRMAAVVGMPDAAPATGGSGGGNGSAVDAAAPAAPAGDAPVAVGGVAETHPLPPDEARLGGSTEAPATPARAPVSTAALRPPRGDANAPVPNLVVELQADEVGRYGLLTVQDIANPGSRIAEHGAGSAGEAGAEEAGGAESRGALAVQAVRAAGTALTAGTVWWALRAGGLMASLLVVLPAWRHVDLLAVLPDDEDDPWERLGEGDAADDETARDERAVRRVFESTFEGEGR